MPRRTKQKKIMNRKRTMKGGVSFNSPMNFQDIPKTDYYPLNNYENDTSVLPYIVGSRQLGGKKRKTAKKQVRKQKKMKGGRVFFTNDPIMGNGVVVSNNELLSMNQVPGYSGASNISNMLNGGTGALSGPGLSYTYVNNALV